MKVLVIDVGGSKVKLAIAGGGETRRFASGSELGPQELVREVKARTTDWTFDAISLGFPGHVAMRAPASEPGNLGDGWVGFDFERAFNRPVRVVNDAALQALGAYEGGRMLFLGLGTGLGSALVIDRVIVSLELGELPNPNGETLGERLGRKGLERHGKEAWQQTILDVIPRLCSAFIADYVVLGGGNAELVDPLPPDTRRGGNDDAITGGERLWREFIEPHDRQPANFWRVVG